MQARAFTLCPQRGHPPKRAARAFEIPRAPPEHLPSEIDFGGFGTGSRDIGEWAEETRSKSTHGCSDAVTFMRWTLQDPNSGKSSCPKSLNFWNTLGPAPPTRPYLARDQNSGMPAQSGGDMILHLAAQTLRVL
jgi:hypothetical protein